jgi:hypothetical protein
MNNKYNINQKIIAYPPLAVNEILRLVFQPHPINPPLLQRRGGRKRKRGYAPILVLRQSHGA